MKCTADFWTRRQQSKSFYANDTSNIKKACANPLFSQKGLYICFGMV
jgi:hypothetical protein